MVLKLSQTKKYIGLLAGILLWVSPANAQEFFGLAEFHLEGKCDQHLGCNQGLEGIPVDAFTHLPPPAIYSPSAIREANIIVNYNGFPEDVIIAFGYAVDIWSVLLTSNVTIRIDATWEDL